MAERPATDVETVRAIAQKHGLVGGVVPMPKFGIINDIWAIGDEFVLRIPTDSDYVGTLLSENVAAVAARSIGVNTPEVVVFDSNLDLIDVPYMVTRRVKGKTLGATPASTSWDMAAYEWSAVLADLASELARLHQKVKVVNDPEGFLNPWWLDDPFEELYDSVERGSVSPEDAVWATAFIDRLKKAFSYDPAGPSDRSVFVHHDVHPGNIMVTDPVGQNPPRLAAVLDWGCACWGDPAVDFSGLPLWALPPLVEAYRLAGGQIDDTFEGRVLYMWLAVALVEPSFLNGENSNRYWWRLPEEGIKELQYRLFVMPERWKQWAV